MHRSLRLRIVYIKKRGVAIFAKDFSGHPARKISKNHATAYAFGDIATLPMTGIGKLKSLSECRQWVGCRRPENKICSFPAAAFE